MATDLDLAAAGFTSCGVDAERLDIEHLDPFGRGPFCRLIVTTTAPCAPGVYSWVVDGAVQYIGKASSLLQIVRGQRMNAAYNDYTYMPRSKVTQKSSPRVRVNGLLNRAITAGKTATWWWRATDTEASALRLEAELIQRWNPPWNRARPLVNQDEGEAAW
jgi:excinuclease UvrABC nuclease subunit